MPVLDGSMIQVPSGADVLVWRALPYWAHSARGERLSGRGAQVRHRVRGVGHVPARDRTAGSNGGQGLPVRAERSRCLVAAWLACRARRKSRSLWRSPPKPPGYLVLFPGYPRPILHKGTRQTRTRPRRKQANTASTPAAPSCRPAGPNIPPSHARSGDAPWRLRVLPSVGKTTVPARSRPAGGGQPDGRRPDGRQRRPAVRRIRIAKPTARRERPWRQPLPHDPRDPDIVRVKELARTTRTHRQANRK